MPTTSQELSDDPSGGTVSALERAHAAVLDAQERARHPHANPLARPRLKAAQEAEQQLLDQLGYATYSEATFSGFRSRSRLSPDATASAAGVEDLPTSSSDELSADLPTSSSDQPSDELSDASAGVGSMPLDAAARLITPPDGGQRVARHTPPSPNTWDQPAGQGEEDPAGLLARLRVVAADFVDAEVLEAKTTSAHIIEAARRGAQATKDAARKIQETAAVASAASASDLEGLLGLIDGLLEHLSSAQGDVRSRIDLIRRTSQKSQEPTARAVPAPRHAARREDSSSLPRPSMQNVEA